MEPLARLAGECTRTARYVPWCPVDMRRPDRLEHLLGVWVLTGSLKVMSGLRGWFKGALRQRLSGFSTGLTTLAWGITTEFLLVV